jgi:methionine biosynthesis protein MetW
MSARADHARIASLVPKGARVLDVGCGDGALLEFLSATRGVEGRGLELSLEGVNACVARGLPVVQGDADRDLAFYPDKAFDVAILSDTIQATQDPKEVLGHLLRIADSAIVSFPNFGHWRVRFGLLTRGRMPMSRRLPDPWWATRNIHMCTIADFIDLTREMGAKVTHASAVTAGRPIPDFDPLHPLASASANWLGEEAIFVVTRA